MSDLVWEDPPPPAPGNKARKFTAAAAQLRDHPGKWAILARYGAMNSAYSIATRLRTGERGIFMPTADFEFKTGRVGDECRVYGRYVGAS